MIAVLFSFEFRIGYILIEIITHLRDGKIEGMSEWMTMTSEDCQEREKSLRLVINHAAGTLGYVTE